MRVHELAKDLGMSSKDLLEELVDLNVEVKNHMAALSDDQVTMIRRELGFDDDPAEGSEASAVAEKSATDAAAVKTEAEKTSSPEQKEEAPSAGEKEEPEETSNELLVRGPIIVKEYAEQLGLRPNQLIAELMTMNVFASINERIELKIAQQLAQNHGFVLVHEKKVQEHKPQPPKPEEQKPEKKKDKVEDLHNRPPIVTFLGHVDHGKTSLLDRIRETRVAAGEKGGITQHIGAYTVNYNDQMITFLDTPGHAAFTAMRARGANLTDIAVLIIAADDGIMPQTREAIQHAQAAGVTIMVAINKIDMRSANVDRVKRQLLQEGLTPEDLGGELICCPVSAVTGEGIDHLLEMILLQSELLELKANPGRPAQGYVIEAKLEAGMGPTANLLIHTGTLHVGDAIVCGPSWGKVKALINDQGIKVRTAGPSYAVKCLGLNSVPEPGSEFLVYPNEKAARATSEERTAKKRLEDISAPKRASLDDLLNTEAGQKTQELALILKADVQGSLEAIQQSLMGIKSDKVSLKFVLGGVGSITENDVLLATASNAIIVGFHVGKENGVNAAAKREGVEIRLYSIIYELLDEIRDAMTGLLEPLLKEKVIGRVEVRQVFELSKRGKVAGCMVKDGKATSKARARLIRGGDTIYEGAISSLKRFQNDASEVREGQECGIRLDNFADIEVGDTIELYEMEKIKQEL